MARHRAAPARAATPPASPDPAIPTARATTATATAVADPPGPLLPRQGLTEAHPSGPLPRARSRRSDGARRAHDPHTSPLDLAAIALAAAKERRSAFPATGSSPATAAPVARTAADEPLDGVTTGGTPRPAYPAAVPSGIAPLTPSHAVPAVGGRPAPRRRVALPTRTAGALALVGALDGGGDAIVGGGTMMAADTTTDTGQIAAPDLAAGSAPAAAAAASVAPDRDERPQGGRHRADGTGASSAAPSAAPSRVTPDADGDADGSSSGY
ncbi:hypothetical protein GCM10023200_06360 [Actinomycetospora chlora]|uniref:Uncharacterized protein n=1 Tax=Actinomycetospora chlora TaxID=663608 RepID=A0ABP9A8E0_9PSEU